MSERRRGRDAPPPEPPKEATPKGPYYRVARYPGEESAGVVYDQAQELIYRAPCDLSVFRLQLLSGWHVAVVGMQPSPELTHHI